MEGQNPDPRGFICDEMLKKLARWLRIAGYDVLSPTLMNDDELVEMSISEKRILLTRDKDLSNRKDVESCRMISDELDGQIEEFIGRFPPETYPRADTRCALCNGGLMVVSKGDVDNNKELQDRIPLNVQTYCSEYYKCISCGKVYWRGSHWDRIEERLDRFSIKPRLPS
jgi:uncharacterized protein with PIN domain